MQRHRPLKRRVIFVALAACAAGTAAAQGWAEHRSEDGNFRVLMPGPAAVSTASLPMRGSETAPMTEAQVRTPGATYQAIFIAYPRSVGASASADVLLDTFRNNMSAGMTRRGDTNLTLGRFSGREFTLVESGTRNVAVRFYWIRGKLYQLLVSGGPGIDAQPDTRRFFDSFALLKS